MANGAQTQTGTAPLDRAIRANPEAVGATAVELIINLNAAKTLGITFPLSLVGRADEVIE